MLQNQGWNRTSKAKLVGAAVACGLLAALTAPAMAQSARGDARSSYKGRLARPAVSPYLNLYRNDAGALPNYQTLVRPQLQQQSVNQLQQRQMNQLQEQLEVGRRSQELVPVPPTGHPSRFHYFSHFYQAGRGAPPNK